MKRVLAIALVLASGAAACHRIVDLTPLRDGGLGTDASLVIGDAVVADDAGAHGDTGHD